MPSVFLFYLLCAITDCPPPASHRESTGASQNNGIGIRRQDLVNDRRYTRSHSNKLEDESNDPPIVTTSLGDIQGRIMESRSGRKIAEFLGIRYALPPTGNRRFSDPVPVRPWTGILNANKAGNDCLQLDISRQLQVRGSDDCLMLNIAAPLVSFHANILAKNVLLQE